MNNYKDLIIWKKAHALVLFVYRQTAAFPKTEQYNLISQIKRAATSMPTNLAEGCGKFSQSDFARYLQISLGSTQDVEYLAFLSHELGYLKDDQFKQLDKTLTKSKQCLLA